MTDEEMSLIQEIQYLFRLGITCFKDKDTTPKKIKFCRNNIEKALLMIQKRKSKLSEIALQATNRGGLNLALASIIELQGFPNKNDLEKYKSCLKVAINLGDDSVKYLAKFLLAEYYFEKGKKLPNCSSGTKAFKSFLTLADELIPDHKDVIADYDKFIEAIKLVNQLLLIKKPAVLKSLVTLKKLIIQV